VHSQPWADLELFLAVAESGSFSSAARRLRITQPTVSRRIQALEAALGLPLFRRDADGAHLTAAGERLLPSAQQMARWANELGRSAASVSDEPEGVVRIATAPGFAHDFLVPFARDLRQRLPEVRLELLTGIETIDLSRGHAEIAVRGRRPTQPDLACVARIAVRLGVFASKRYARKLTPPLAPADIDWVTWSAPLEHLAPRPELEALIPGFKPVFASNDFVVQHRAVAEGLGAMILPATRDAYDPYPPLVELPLELPLPEGELFVVCAKAMRAVPRVESVLDLLCERLASVEGVELVRDSE
jgi:DNA-binding transcriptional LysR family regulator